jgi:hypothetical protein
VHATLVGIDKYLFTKKVRKEKVKIVLNFNFVKYGWEKNFIAYYCRLGHADPCASPRHLGIRRRNVPHRFKVGKSKL